MKKAVLGAVGAVVVIAGIVYVLDGLRILSDEPPIRVRNGSIDLIAGLKNGKQWTWTDEGNNYSHEPPSFEVDITKNLWVKVEPNGSPSPETYQCNVTTGDGKDVVVSFLTGTSTVDATFKRVGSYFINQRTKVTPKGAFAPAGSTVLKSAGDGYVTRVRVGQLDCTFKTKESLQVINICMSSSDTDCQ